MTLAQEEDEAKKTIRREAQEAIKWGIVSTTTTAALLWPFGIHQFLPSKFVNAYGNLIESMYTYYQSVNSNMIGEEDVTRES